MYPGRQSFLPPMVLCVWGGVKVMVIGMWVGALRGGKWAVVVGDVVRGVVVVMVVVVPVQGEVERYCGVDVCVMVEVLSLGVPAVLEGVVVVLVLAYVVVPW